MSTGEIYVASTGDFFQSLRIFQTDLINIRNVYNTR